jgi:hypothetical protein
VGLRLALHGDKTVVNTRRQGLKFLGFKLHPIGRRMLRDSVVRFRRRVVQRLRQLHQGLISAPSLTQSVRAWIAHTGHANCTGLRRRLFRELFRS